jgi:hypothetical protein
MKILPMLGASSTLFPADRIDLKHENKITGM